jgi:hypothetical protein
MKKTIYQYEDLFAHMTDLTKLAIPPQPGEMAGCQSSYDRKSKYDPETDTYLEWGANADAWAANEHEGEPVFECDGPGVIWRTWFGALIDGTITIYIDDMETPAVKTSLREYLFRFLYTVDDGNCPNMTPTPSRGFNRLIPIPFNKKCRIFLSDAGAWFFHFTYQKMPAGTVLPAYNDDIDRALGMGLRSTERTLQLRGEYPYANEDEKLRKTCTATIEAGQTVELFRDDISGAITKIRWDLNDVCHADRARVMEALRLKIYWDGREEPAVTAPFGAFFGSYPGYNPYRTLPMSMHGGCCYSYFYMPYRSARMTITNTSCEPIVVTVNLTYEKITDEEADAAMRFCARFQAGGEWDGLDRSRFARGGDRWPDWPVLRLQGTGRFCGFALHVNNAFPDVLPDIKWWEGELIHWPKGNCFWWGEGDEKFFVDGEKFPSTFGTGTEDYFGFSCSANWPFITFDSAYVAQSSVDSKNNNGHTSLVRFQVSDNVPFQTSFDAFLEKYRDDKWSEFWNNIDVHGTCDFAVTGYWYQFLN